jgi:hypothetical protein
MKIFIRRDCFIFIHPKFDYRNPCLRQAGRTNPEIERKNKKIGHLSLGLKLFRIDPCGMLRPKFVLRNLSFRLRGPFPSSSLSVLWAPHRQFDRESFRL